MTDILEMTPMAKQKAMMIVAKQMRVLPKEIKDDYMRSFEHLLTDVFGQQRLALALYRDFYFTPYCQPQYSSLVTVKDIKNRKRFGIIFRGIRGYMEGSEADREAFRKSVFTAPGLVAKAKYDYCAKRELVRE